MQVAILVILVLVGIANLAVCAMLLMRGKLDVSGPIASVAQAVDRAAERTDRGLREEISRNREESAKNSRELREEVLRTLSGLSTSNDQRIDAVRQTLDQRLASFANLQAAQFNQFDSKLGELRQANQQQMESMRDTVERKLSAIQIDNNQKLEQMRATVDEKLHATLEQRLGESFKIVSDRLELVHKGLGEMQSLATGVGDLKKVLTNIKTRGSWGEVQLGNLLEQMLTPDQYSANVAVNPMSGERVDFAIKLPGRMGDGDQPVWLPIDAKFPQEDYHRLVDAGDRGDAAAVLESAIALEQRVIAEARKIREKYVAPPNTTDFAILFLPTEGLFAEVLRRPGVCEKVQREHRVVLAGPTTLAAVLSSLQMGFRTLIIERRSSEVWQVLGGIKTEFSKFGLALEKVKKKLQEATNTMDKAAVRSRAVEKRLKEVQEMPIDALPSITTPALLPGTETPIQSEPGFTKNPEAAA
jgi:DNA recombination protein RmuC